MIRTGTICASFLYNYLKNDYTTDEDTSDETSRTKIFRRKKKIIHCMADTFGTCGGVLTKISQILNIDSGISNSSVFSECKPYNPQLTVKYIQKEIDTNDIFKDISDFDKVPCNSGSIGQVHRAKYKGDDVVLKVQYKGLAEQIKTDFGIIDNVAHFMFDDIDYRIAVKDIKRKINEEIDYTQEVKNHKLFYDIWKNHDTIKIAEVIDDLCTDKIITMKYIDGENLNEFLKHASEEDIYFFAQHIFEFIFVSLFSHSVFYNDIHYGNFLITEHNKLYVMDFGSINHISEELLHNFKNVYSCMLNKDHEMLAIVLEDLGILPSTTPDEEVPLIFEHFELILAPILYDGDFEFTDEWYKKVSGMHDIRNEWNVPDNVIYLAKIPYGLFPLFVKMKVKANFKEMLTKILEL